MSEKSRERLMACGCRSFGSRVKDPRRFGVVQIENGRIVRMSISQRRVSDYALAGLSSAVKSLD